MYICMCKYVGDRIGLLFLPCGPNGDRILLHSCILSVVGDEHDHKSYLIVSVLRGCYSQISKLEEVEYSSTFDLQIGVPSGFRYDGCRS